MNWHTIVENGENVGFVGEELWDLCDKFLEDVVKLYQDNLYRDIQDREIREIIKYLRPSFAFTIEELKGNKIT